jgi:hypothetical protein
VGEGTKHGAGGAEAGGEREREGRGRGVHTGTKMEKLNGQQWRKAHSRRRSSSELRRKSSIGDEPTVGLRNRQHRDEALYATNTTVPSDSAKDIRIESNCSLELNRPKFR